MVPSRPHVVALHGLGVPAERLDRLSEAFRLPSWRPGTVPSGEEGGGSVLVLVGSADAAEAPECWARPFAAWIEIGASEVGATGTEATEPWILSDAVLADVVERARRADLYAFVTTATANQLHLAGRILQAIAARRTLIGAQRDDMELALHEAISNAVVHGNLQVEGMKGLSVAALERFSHDLAERMANPAYSNRRVEVAVWLDDDDAVTVEVADEGSGFARPEHIDYGASGRGLDLIAAIAEEIQLLDGGRRIRMRFPL